MIVDGGSRDSSFAHGKLGMVGVVTTTVEVDELCCCLGVACLCVRERRGVEEEEVCRRGLASGRAAATIRGLVVGRRKVAESVTWGLVRGG